MLTPKSFSKFSNSEVDSGDSGRLQVKLGKGPTCRDSWRISGKTNDFAMLAKRYARASNPFSLPLEETRRKQAVSERRWPPQQTLPGRHMG